MRDVTPDELRATFSVPTVVVNRFLVSTNPVQIRIAFGESLNLEDEVNWRVALSLTPYEANELQIVLSKLLEVYTQPETPAETGTDGKATE